MSASASGHISERDGSSADTGWAWEGSIKPAGGRATFGGSITDGSVGHGTVGDGTTSAARSMS